MRPGRKRRKMQELKMLKMLKMQKMQKMRKMETPASEDFLIRQPALPGDGKSAGFPKSRR